MRRSLALLAFALASCETTSTPLDPPRTTPTPLSPPASFLARFADAMRFVPAGMQSHWFSDHRNVDGLSDTRPKCLRVRCARNFQAPREVGVGAYEGVTIQDHGASPIPAARRAALGELRPSIAGAEVRWQSGLHSSGRVSNWETWGAIVDERFVVTATSEELLRQALARNGSPSFGKLEPLPDFDPATVDLVLRDLAGSKPVDAPTALNVQGVSAIGALVSLPVRVQIWARDPRELQAIQGLFDPLNGWNEPTRHAQQADLHFLEIQKSSEVEEPLATSRLHLERFFGLWVSI